MTDYRDDIKEINRRRLTVKEKMISAALLLSIVGIVVCFCLPRKNAAPVPQPSKELQRIETATQKVEPVTDLLELFNTGLRSPEHPMRKLAEKELAIGVSNRTIKRGGLILTALDPEGKTVSVQWDEFIYKKWGGLFFHETRHATFQTVFYNGQWMIISCIDEHGARIVDEPGIPIPSKPADCVLIRIWNDMERCFCEFDESVSRFDSTKPNVIIIHGMGGSTQTAWIQRMGIRIRQYSPETNIIGVDWSSLQVKDGFNKASEESSKSWAGIKDRLAVPIDILLMPTSTADRIPDVVNQTDERLFGEDSIGLKQSKTHLIGFSHGCHVAGMLGMKHLDNRIARLTVLDPSTRLVHLNPDNRWGAGWDKSAAGFIDMYASSKWAGSGKLYGHKTFFVMEKSDNRFWRNPKDWELFNTVADHMYAAKWFLSTVGNEDSRFGYSIDTAQGMDTSWSGTILSSLPKKGEFDGIGEEVINEMAIRD